MIYKARAAVLSQLAEVSRSNLSAETSVVAPENCVALQTTFRSFGLVSYNFLSSSHIGRTGIFKQESV